MIDDDGNINYNNNNNNNKDIFTNSSSYDNQILVTIILIMIINNSDGDSIPLLCWESPYESVPLAHRTKLDITIIGYGL